MRTITVSDSDRRDWRVRVVWQPRWRALARRFGGWRRRRRGPSVGDAGDVLSGIGDGTWGNLGDDLLAGIAVIIGLIVFGALFWWLLLPLLLLVVDALVLTVLLVVAVAGRVLLRRPWTVEAVPVDSPGNRYTTDVVGWRAALRTRDGIAERLRDGVSPAG